MLSKRSHYRYTGLDWVMLGGLGLGIGLGLATHRTPQVSLKTLLRTVLSTVSILYSHVGGFVMRVHACGCVCDADTCACVCIYMCLCVRVCVKNIPRRITWN